MVTELFSSRKGRIPRINLMTARQDDQERIRQNCRHDLAGLGALCVLAGCVFVPLSLHALRLQAQVRKAQSATQTELRQVEQNAQTSGDVEARLAQWARFTKSRTQRFVWRDTLHALVAPLPSQIAVEHIQLDGKGETITATLVGSGENVGAVGDYAGALERGVGLRQAHLTGASLDATFGPEAAKFTISVQAGKAEK